MSQENVEVVRRVYEALNRRDADAAFAAADPDFVQDWSRSIGPEPGIFRGRDQVVQFLRSLWDAFDETFFLVEELIDAGDRVVAVVRTRNRGRGSGVVVEAGGAVQVWTFRNGRMISSTLYQERAEALEAVGLRE